MHTYALCNAMRVAIEPVTASIKGPKPETGFETSRNGYNAQC